MRTYSPGGLLIAFAAAPKDLGPPTPSNHRLRRGLPGYLILLAPHAFEPQRQLQSSKPPSPLVSDYLDSHREISPLKKADDAVELDTTGLSIDGVVDAVKAIIAEKTQN